MPETCVISFVKRWLLAVLAITFYFSRGTTRGQLTSRKLYQRVANVFDGSLISERYCNLVAQQLVSDYRAT